MDGGRRRPTWSRKQPWLDTLRRERENGQASSRVRILSERVSDYERYACGFGYRYNIVSSTPPGEACNAPPLGEADGFVAQVPHPATSTQSCRVRHLRTLRHCSLGTADFRSR
ncbi:MAG: DUF6879 family protein [Pseudonocardiaceae bacterium]